MSLPTLRIQSDNQEAGGKFLFRLQGVIDVSAIPLFEPLQTLPADSEVELDFSEVQRVNSMGLAQLLKLFEHWQANDIRVGVRNANRMTGMLFRMTGLDRFLTLDETPHATRAANDGPTTRNAVRPGQVPAAHSSPPRPPAPPAPAPAAFSPRPVVPPVAVPHASTEKSTEALNWHVYGNNPRQLNGWYFLNTYLQRRLSLPAHLELADQLLSRRDQQALLPDLAFVSPFSAIQWITRHGFMPLAGPSGHSDEVAILARAEDSRGGIEEFIGGIVASASADSFVYLLGRHLLDSGEIPSEGMDYRFTGHEIKAVQMLLKGDADLLFLHVDSYQRLSAMTRRMLRLLDQSDARFACHLWCLAPRRRELKESVQTLLTDMSNDPQGQQILTELGYTSWIEPEQEDIGMLERIFRLYSGVA